MSLVYFFSIIIIFLVLVFNMFLNSMCDNIYLKLCNYLSMCLVVLGFSYMVFFKFWGLFCISYSGFEFLETVMYKGMGMFMMCLVFYMKKMK